VFLVSEDGGELPNTADKRYPVFRLEPTVKEQFRPIIEFLSYVGADLKSTLNLCQRAFRHPYMQVPMYMALGLGVVCLVGVCAVCYYRARTIGHDLTRDTSEFANVEIQVVMTHYALLTALASVALLSGWYSALVCSNLVQQMRARRRARLKTVAAQFSRLDWVGVIPGLYPGQSMYECLYETAPSAHHEAERVKAAV
jgi:hypothetical protein